MNKFGCIYKTNKGKDRLIIKGYESQALTTSILNDSRVLVFESRGRIAEFMSKFRAADGGSESSRHIDGNYKVIKLEPIFVIAGYRVKEENEDGLS